MSEDLAISVEHVSKVCSTPLARIHEAIAAARIQLAGQLTPQRQTSIAGHRSPCRQSEGYAACLMDEAQRNIHVITPAYCVAGKTAPLLHPKFELQAAKYPP